MTSFASRAEFDLQFYNPPFTVSTKLWPWIQLNNSTFLCLNRHKALENSTYFKGTGEMHQSKVWDKHWNEIQRKETCNPALFFKRKKDWLKKHFRINTGSETTIRSQNNDVRKNNSKQKWLKKLEATTGINPDAKMKRMSEMQLLD